jgi:hypothetical protein
MARRKELGQLKNTVTSSGMNPRPFRPVAWSLNHRRCVIQNNGQS